MRRVSFERNVYDPVIPEKCYICKYRKIKPYIKNIIECYMCNKKVCNDCFIKRLDICIKCFDL